MIKTLQTVIFTNKQVIHGYQSTLKCYVIKTVGHYVGVDRLWVDSTSQVKKHFSWKFYLFTSYDCMVL